MTLRTKYFLFGRGYTQDTDDRLKDADAPRAVENLVKRKNGRLGVRFDYDALVMTSKDAAGSLTLYDLHTYNERLIGFGTDGLSAFIAPAPFTIFEYVNQPTHAWISGKYDTNASVTLGNATNVRDIFTTRGASEGIGDDTGDVASGSGRAVVVRKSSLAVNTFFVDLIDSEDGHVISTQAAPATSFPGSYTFLRVVCTGTKFFLCGVDSATFAIKLFVYDPAVSGIFTALTDPAAAGAAVQCFDMSMANEGTTFVVAYSRTGPTTRIHEFDANGTELNDFAGAAVAFDMISVFAEAINASTKRVHVIGRVTATTALNLYTYLLATTALENTSLAFGGVNSSSQATMAVLRDPPQNCITVAWSDTSTDVRIIGFTNNTHAILITISSFTNARLGSKFARSGGQTFCALLIPQTSGTELSNYLYRFAPDFVTGQSTYPALKADTLLARQPSPGNLPSLALNAASGNAYWLRYTVLEQPFALTAFTQSILARVTLCGRHRRQTAQVSDVLYIAGGIPQAYDGFFAKECGFLARPRILNIAQGGGGSIGLLSTHQLVLVYETFDRQNNLIQSEPSDVYLVTMTGANNTVTVTAQTPHEIRFGVSNIGDTQVLAVLYATLNTAGGNITFHRAGQAFTDGRAATNLAIVYNKSDTVLSQGSILYSQGARGALSGPLPFEPPPACISITASADKGLIGGLQSLPSVQESRPHFESEELNWSNSFGFSRDARGRVLAVARLDERRIIFTDTELFEMDGPGIDDNGNGDLGAPRRLPSDVGLYGGELGWCSIVECSLGILFRGLVDQIYLLPRGGVTPVAIGSAVEDVLNAFPITTAAVYLPDDQTVRFSCNNAGNTDSINILLDVRFTEWFIEGPFGAPILAATRFGSTVVHLRSNTVFRQRTSHPPAAFIANAWRSGSIHPFGPGNFGAVDSVCFYGEYRGECFIGCTFLFDDLTTEALPAERVFGIGVGQPFSKKFTPNQQQCECVRVDFDVTSPVSPQIASETTQQLVASAATGITLDPLRRRGDRIILALQAKSVAGFVGVLVPTGWTSITSTGFTSPGQIVRVMEKTMDSNDIGQLANTLVVDCGSGNYGSVLQVKQWVVRGQDTATPTQASFGTTAGAAGTTNNINPLTPTWGALPTLWIAYCAVESEGAGPNTFSAFPTGFTSTGELRAVSTDPAQDGAIGWGSQVLTTATLDPDNFVYAGDASRGRSNGVLMAIRPAQISEGLVYHYWTMDHLATGASALKSPASMAGG